MFKRQSLVTHFMHQNYSCHCWLTCRIVIEFMRGVWSWISHFTALFAIAYARSNVPPPPPPPQYRHSIKQSVGYQVTTFVSVYLHLRHRSTYTLFSLQTPSIGMRLDMFFLLHFIWDKTHLKIHWTTQLWGCKYVDCNHGSKFIALKTEVFGILRLTFLRLT